MCGKFFECVVCLLFCLQYKCCGANLFEDWQYSYWQKENLSEGLKVPNSCCKTITPHCGKSDHPSNIHYTVSSQFQL